MTDTKSNNYKIINNLFTSQEDFIVLGLCGKTGSGCSTATNILQESFSELHLPTPNSDSLDFYKDHEYRILYNFAKVNWQKFYRIKTSALISASVLQYPIDLFRNFLLQMLDTNENGKDGQDLLKLCNRFYSKKMVVCFDNWFKLKHNRENYCEWLKCDFTVEKLNGKIKDIMLSEEMDKEDNCHSGKIKSFRLDMSDPTASINYYQIKNTTFAIENKELYKMFIKYQNDRDKKTNFINPIYFFILKKYIFDFLPRITKDFWNEVRKISKSLPTLAMQMLGINLRISGKPFLKSEDTSVCADGYVTIAKRINLAIKILSSYKYKLFELKKCDSDTENADRNKHTLVVVDSIKNPFESLFLKQRYSNYYLIGMYTEDVERIKRLEIKDFIQSTIKEIDTIENLSDFKSAYKKTKEKSNDNPSKSTVDKLVRTIRENNYYSICSFVLQNVASCLDSADIFINNIADNKSFLKLKYELLKYVSLIMHPGLILPTEIERCMQIAYTAKLNSGCISRQVGAVITDSDYHLLSIGWNQQPEGQLPCSYRNLKELNNHWSTESYSDYENDDNEAFLKSIKKFIESIYSSDSILYQQGKLPYFCFKDIFNKIEKKQNQVHPRSLHAEETAFLNLGSAGKLSVKGGCLFTTSSPCELCSKKAKYMQISKIFYVEPYSGISYKHVLSAGIKESRPDFILFTGAIGRAYMQLYTPLLPLKDEHELWLGEKTENLLIKGGDDSVKQENETGKNGQ